MEPSDQPPLNYAVQPASEGVAYLEEVVDLEGAHLVGAADLSEGVEGFLDGEAHCLTRSRGIRRSKRRREHRSQMLPSNRTSGYIKGAFGCQKTNSFRTIEQYINPHLHYNLNWPETDGAYNSYGGQEQKIWQKLVDSQGPSYYFGSRKHMDLYCVEYDQENGVISDLEKITCQRTEIKNMLPTQKKISVPELSL